MSEKQIEKLLANPTKLAVEGRLFEAQRAFEKISGTAESPSLRKVDLTARFGLSLCGLGIMLGDEMAVLGREYLAEATAGYRRVAGNADPLVADALQVEFACLTKPEQLSRGGSLLTEALAIRRDALGAEHSATRMTMRLLADLHGQEAQADPTKIQSAIAEYEALIKISPAVMTYGDFAGSGPAIRFDLAVLLLRNRLKEEAVVQAITARREISTWPDEYRCAGIELGMGYLATQVVYGMKAGPTWSALRKKIIDGSPMDCAIDSSSG